MGAYVWIAVGGALGSVARHWCTVLAARHLGAGFPWGTILVNVVGSFLIGLAATLALPGGRLPIGPTGQQFVMVGFCGGYTTFSAFSLQTLALACDGAWVEAGANVVLSVAACLLAVWLGHLAAVALNPTRGA